MSKSSISDRSYHDMRINSRITNHLVLIKHFNPSLELKIREPRNLRIKRENCENGNQTRESKFMLETNNCKLNIINKNLLRGSNYLEVQNCMHDDFKNKSPLTGFPPNPYAHHNSPRSARQLVLLDKTDYTKQSIQRPSNYLENDQLNQLGFPSGKLVPRNPPTNF